MLAVKESNGGFDLRPRFRCITTNRRRVRGYNTFSCDLSFLPKRDPPTSAGNVSPDEGIDHTGLINGTSTRCASTDLGYTPLDKPLGMLSSLQALKR